MKHLSAFLAIVLLLGTAAASTTIQGSKSNGSERVVCRDLACCKANPNAMASNGQPCDAFLKINSGHANEQKQLRLKGRVLSQQGRTFTVLSDGKQFTFYGAKSGSGLIMPNVGATVLITYVQTPDGQLKAITFGRKNPAEERSKGQKGSIQGLKVPAAPTPAKK